MRLLKIAGAFLCAGLIWNGTSVLAQNAPGTPLPPANTIPAPTTSPAVIPGQQPGAPHNPAPPIGKSEMEMREKFETLAQLTSQQLDAELQKWPRYQQMDLAERGKLLQRLAEYRDRRHKVAENKARELGLTLTPDQFAAFETKYWQKKLEADHKLFDEMEPRRKALDQQITAELKQEFSAFTALPTPSSSQPTAPNAAPAK